MNTIENELGFTRDSLISMAMLLGSDYTIGVRGIGPVNATEVIDVFNDLDSLIRWKEWTDKGTFQSDSDLEAEVRLYYKDIAEKEQVSKKIIEEDVKAEIEYKKKHKELVKHWEFPEGFPNRDVYQEYLKPMVDELDGINLEWQAPNFKKIKMLALNELNWHPKEIENCITQTEKRRENGWNINLQKTINDYFNKQHKFAQFKSKRIINAVGRIKRKQEKRVKSS